MLIELNQKVAPRLYICDGIVAMEGNGPTSGDPVSMGVLLMSTDPIALDTVFCHLVNLDPSYVPTNLYGETLGLGTWHDDRIEIVTADVTISEKELKRKYGNPNFNVDRRKARKKGALDRIVGRDTSALSAQEVRTAALETLAENLSDGVVAPLFWYLLLGVPGMLAYKMVNTLDSMVGYKNERYRRFGCFAARLDDVANYIPARLTALLMILVSGRFSLLRFVGKYGSRHASPNSGYPEAALAGILNCRFGGPHYYFGEEVWKPFIGNNERALTTEDMKKAVCVNRQAEVLMVVLVWLTILLSLS